MTTPNDDQGIPVDGAPGGRFYVQPSPDIRFSVQPASSIIKIKCAQCGIHSDKKPGTFTCKKCFINMCTMCVGYGYDDIHSGICNSGADKKGIVDKYIKYVCTCGSTPEVRSCSDCLVKKIKKYNCFNCDPDENRKATLICGNCLNHFICSAECHAKDMSKYHNHTKSCGKSLPIWCKHGRPVLLTELLKCECKMCVHGMWSEDCYICISNDYL